MKHGLVGSALCAFVCTIVFAALLLPLKASAQQPEHHGSRPEETEWTWAVRPPHPDASLPNILLLGDSISRNYYPEVQRQLNGVANVYLFASSIAVGDPRLPHAIAEFGRMEGVSFRLVHMNNGMHGWTYSEMEYRRAMPAFLKAAHDLAPHAQLVWASTTPVRVDRTPGPTNARVMARNQIAQSFMEARHILLDDQCALMMKHRDLYEDDVHFNTVGSNIQGQKAAQQMRALLQH
jgi:hypothetical protein